MPINEETPVTFALLKQESIGSKPVPVATVRSSKLRAMAANINQSQDVEQDIDSMENSADMEDDMEASDNDASMMKLENILIVPEIINNSNIQSIVENRENDIKGSIQAKGLDQNNDDRIALMASDIEQHNENATSKFLQEEKDNDNNASTSSSKDLSLSCVNSSGMSEANYRLEPT